MSNSEKTIISKIMMRKLTITCAFLMQTYVFAQKGLITQTLQTVKSPDGKLLCQLYQKLDKKGTKLFITH
jgi:hypothetical protein